VGILLNVSQHASGSVDMGLMDSIKEKSKERRRMRVAAVSTTTPSRF
jgi:hypothetical protein